MPTTTDAPKRLLPLGGGTFSQNHGYVPVAPDEHPMPQRKHEPGSPMTLGNMREADTVGALLQAGRGAARTKWPN